MNRDFNIEESLVIRFSLWVDSSLPCPRQASALNDIIIVFVSKMK